MKIDEKVPTTIPITSASENPRSTGPPNTSNESAASSVSPEVNTVRLNVWLMLRLIVWASGSRSLQRRFSRMRSNTTMVSFIE